MNVFRKIAIRSHQPAFLWRVAVGIVAAGVLLSIPLRLVQSDQYDPALRCQLASMQTPEQPWRPVAELVNTEGVSFYQTLDAIARISRTTELPPSPELLQAAQQRAPSGPTAEIVREFVASLREGQPTAELRAIAANRPAVQFANAALATAELVGGNLSGVEAALRVEGEFPDALAARELLVTLLRSREAWQALTELAEAPLYQGLVPHSIATQVAAENGDWLTVLRRTPLSLFDARGIGPIILSLLTGACWLAFVLHAGRGSIRWYYCVAGVVLGILSIAPTLFFIYWQEVGWGLQQSEDLAGSVRYFVLGVGLREELAKLMLLLPLVPLLVRDRNELQALLVSACVGLGFAIEENAGYAGNSAVSAISRLTTATFLHMSLTGLVGLAVCRACWHPKSLGPQAIGVFCLAVFLHAFYDTLLATPVLTDYSMLSLILYVLVVYAFFHEFNELRPPGGYRVNLSFTFTVGVALVASATFVVLSMQLGQLMALRMMGETLIGSAATIYLFLREAPDSLVDR